MKQQVTELPSTRTASRHPAWLVRLADFWTLTKPEVNFLVVMSTLAGFYLGWRGPMNFVLLFSTLLGTLLVASGTGTLNQYIERNSDASMHRTARRPLPSGRMNPAAAFWFGIFLAVAGGLLLWLAVNALSSVLALATLLSYLLFYTPLKKRTPLCTLVGAFPGAMPPLLGWTAIRGRIEIEGLVLFAIVFFWQFPHFYSIAWLYREDYQKANIRMLPVVEATGKATGREIIAYSLALLPASMAPTWLHMSGNIYLAGAVIMGAICLCSGLRLARSPHPLASGQSKFRARRLLLATVFYLPLLFALMMINRAVA